LFAGKYSGLIVIYYGNDYLNQFYLVNSACFYFKESTFENNNEIIPIKYVEKAPDLFNEKFSIYPT
jgi:hypothetical protein